MNAIDDGGPAFARTGSKDIHGYGVDDQEGMSLRDYFAAKTMHALVTGAANANMTDIEAINALVAKFPKASYDMADEMLKARKS